MSYDIEIINIKVREPWHLDVKVLVNDTNTVVLSFLENDEILNYHDFYNTFEDKDYDAVLRQVQRLVQNEGWHWNNDTVEFENITETV